MAGGAFAQGQPSDTPLSAGTDLPVSPAGQAVVPAEPPPEGFAAALLTQRLVPQTPTLQEIRLRTPTGWRPPGSPLRLTDRRV
jgi:hypothetical protein